MLPRLVVILPMILLSVAVQAGDIFHAIRDGKVDRVKQLCKDDPALVNATTDHGSTPLHWCAIKGHAELASFLIDNGAKVDTTDKYGLTPLHRAAYWGNPDVAKVLLENGADHTIRDQEKHTPLDWARKRKKDKVVELIEKHAAKD